MGDEKLIFCLAGNPVSALVCLQLFVIPALETISGNEYERNVINVKYEGRHDIYLDVREEFQRCNIAFYNGEWRGTPLTQQLSSSLCSMVCNGLLWLPSLSEAKQTIKTGEIVKAVLIRQ